MPVTLPNLYCTPADVYDLCGTEGIELHLDDHQLGTGQTVLCTGDLATGATSIPITALQYPLLRGSNLNFDGGGMSGVVTVVLNATALVGAMALAVNPLAAPVMAGGQAFDNGVNIATAARLVKACSYATARIKMYCCNRYDDSQLVLSWSVNNWATNLAAHWMSCRRGCAPPKSLENLVETTMDELRMVKTGTLSIEDIGTRTSGWPFITNVSVDPRYTYAKIRVEQNLSEGTPTQYPQYPDWNAALFIEW